MVEICPGCQASVPASDGPTHSYIGASAGCWKLFGELLAREYSDPEYMKVHRLSVDAYAAQHPGKPGRRSSQSVSVHLLALYLLLEKKTSHEYITRILDKVIKEKKNEFEWLEPPSSLGSMTAADVLPARNAREHAELVQRWAQSVWEAWAPHHEAIRTLAQSYLAEDDER